MAHSDMVCRIYFGLETTRFGAAPGVSRKSPVSRQTQNRPYGTRRPRNDSLSSHRSAAFRLCPLVRIRRAVSFVLANLGEALGPNAGNRELVEALTVWTPAQLAPLLSCTTSAVMLQEGGERLLTNVRSIFSGYLQGWKYTPEGAFSFRSYMTERDDRAWLWIPYRESEIGVARGLVTCWTDTLVTAAFDRPEGAATTWIVIDELDSLGELSSLIEATTKLRKRRVVIVAAIQSLSQLATHYGPDKARTLLNCFSNLLVLRSVEPDTAEALSRHLGEREYWEESHSESTSSGSLGRDSSSTTRTKRQTRIVLPSEIQSLPDLHGFLKPAGPWPVVTVEAELPQA